MAIGKMRFQLASKRDELEQFSNSFESALLLFCDIATE